MLVVTSTTENDRSDVCYMTYNDRKDVLQMMAKVMLVLQKMTEMLFVVLYNMMTEVMYIVLSQYTVYILYILYIIYSIRANSPVCHHQSPVAHPT